jgi:hypothetical protein
VIRPWSAVGAAVLALTASTAASAAGGGEVALRPAFNAVIVSTHPDGRQAKLWINRDHTYRAQGRKGQRSAGVWKVKGARLCLTQKRPAPIFISYCKAIPAIRPGRAWSDRAVTGETVSNRLVPRG